ncbi:unnamed protein product [Peronospora destructor]|uniref:FAD/NAD(P)-binding domain-containing protein n=1 Tax=Peronospora destructor TaxID=86335 RepID=A0AAV0V567_9STRA|nr:unnamed protein product [Peronospora destructor]
MTRIVIIGGGAAGINTLQALARHLKASDNTEIVLLEKNSYFYHVAPPCKFARIIRGVATRISVGPNEVSYHAIDIDDKKKGGLEQLSFDYLVLATGSIYSVPIKPGTHDYTRLAMKTKLQEVRHHIEQAEKIVVIGGGAVGCEVAAEIKFEYPNKSVTIVDGNEKLVSGNNLRLENHGVKVILGERLTEHLNGNSFEKCLLHTDKGTEIESDIQLLRGGFSPVATLVQEMDASLVTERGTVKVNNQLQLEDEKYGHLFALGDMCNHSAPKMAFIAGKQGKFLANELAAVIHKKQPRFTNPFEVPAVAATILSLGPSGGVSQLPVCGGIVVGDWFTWLLKSRDYFAGRIWASIGATVPN